MIGYVRGHLLSPYRSTSPRRGEGEEDYWVHVAAILLTVVRWRCRQPTNNPECLDVAADVKRVDDPPTISGASQPRRF